MAKGAKGKGENVKAVAATQRKADAKAAKDQVTKAREEDQYWAQAGEGSKSKAQAKKADQVQTAGTCCGELCRAAGLTRASTHCRHSSATRLQPRRQRQSGWQQRRPQAWPPPQAPQQRRLVLLQRSACTRCVPQLCIHTRAEQADCCRR